MSATTQDYLCKVQANNPQESPIVIPKDYCPIFSEISILFDVSKLRHMQQIVHERRKTHKLSGDEKLISASRNKIDKLERQFIKIALLTLLIFASTWAVFDNTGLLYLGLASAAKRIYHLSKQVC